MYTRRTVEALAAVATGTASNAAASTPATQPPAVPLRPASPATRVATGALQLLSIALFYAVPVLLLSLSLHYRSGLTAWPLTETLVVSALAVLLYVPLACLLVVALKWLVIGRFWAGEYPLWSYYYRFGVVRKLVEAAPTQLLSVTPFLAAFYRLLGARIGANVYLGSTRLMCFNLLTIGDEASVVREAGLLGYRVERDRLVIEPIEVGRGAYVGLRSILEGSTALGDAAGLDDLSVLPAGRRVPAREVWLGSPVQRLRAARWHVLGGVAGVFAAPAAPVGGLCARADLCAPQAAGLGARADGAAQDWAALYVPVCHLRGALPLRALALAALLVLEQCGRGHGRAGGTHFWLLPA